MLRTSLKGGIEQLRANWRMVWIYYLTSLAFGVLLMLPLWNSLRHFIGKSEMGVLLAGRLDWDFVFEFFHENASLFSVLSGMITAIFVLNLLWSLFLSGGALAVFVAARGYSPDTFWSSAAKYFGRFLRLAAWSLLPALVLLLVLFLPAVVKRLIFGSDPLESVSYWTRWVTVSLSYLALLLWRLVFDYARLHTVTAEEQNMRRALREGLRFVWRNLARALALALLFFLAGALVLVIYNPLADSLSAPNVLVIFLLFVLQQGYMFWRKLLSLALYASETRLYREIQQAAQEQPQPANELGWEGAWA